MMKFIIGIISIIIFGFFAHQILEWWVIVIAAGLIGGILNLSSWRSFVFGFIGAAILWGGYSFILDLRNEHLLSSQLAILFGNINRFSLIIICSLIGGILGGLGSATGSLGRKLISKEVLKS